MTYDPLENARYAVEDDAWSQVREPYALPLEDFIAARSQSPVVLIGSDEDIVLPAHGLLMLGGRGGRGKTTLMVDGALHMASGVDWLGMKVPRPLRILFVENEGAREPFRRKLADRLAHWQHEVTGALFMATAGNAPAAIQARAGHADYSTTQRYIDLAGVVFREEAERAEARVLGGPIVGTDSEETGQDPAGAAGLEPATPGFGDRCSAS
jgi:AAA domain